MRADSAHEREVTITDLYEQLQGRLHRYATRLTRDESEANDLVQETFLRALAHSELLGQLNRQQCRAWLYRVLKNLFVDRQRARQRQQALVKRLTRKALIACAPPPAALSPDFFDRLPPRYQEVLQRRYVLRMTSEEIGHDLGIPAATARSRIRLAIKWLRTHRSEWY